MGLLLIGIIAFAAAVTSGLLGLGGAVLLIPAYLYTPALFGIAPLGIKSISGMTSVQVLASALLGMWTHKRHHSVDSQLALRMGLPITAASFVGAMASTLADPDFIVGVFASLAILSALLIVSMPAAEDTETTPGYSLSLAVAIASSVGFFGGIVGAPGAFLLSPLMMVVLKIPTRVTIGTTLGIVVLSALAASAGKLFTGQVPPLETAVAVAASLPGVLLGSRWSYRCSPRLLRRALAVLILSVGAGMWYEILTKA
jgi:uncharacterized membrane protein YfcA